MQIVIAMQNSALQFCEIYLTMTIIVIVRQSNDDDYWPHMVGDLVDLVDPSHVPQPTLG